MATYTYVVTQRVNYYNGVEAESPREILDLFQSGDWDHKHNEVLSDCIQVYDEQGFLVLDTDPGDCEVCGRSENASFVRGAPRCHRHLI
jgi:hypothetical protein